MVYICSMFSKSDLTRQFIIEKSAPIFNTKGYSATSMNDILQATGLTKGGVYGNFDSKDQIAIEAFELSIGKVKEGIRFKTKNESTAQGKLFAIFNFYKNFSIIPLTEGGCPLLNTAIEADDNLPFMKVKAQKALNELLASLEYIIQNGIESNEFKEGIDAKKEAALIFSVIQGGLMMSKLSDNPKILNGLLETLKTNVTSHYLK
ncbi:MAG TPA: TetR/AcrR family transcriptional regulator [Saprospiraceae bacterium]|nr:TetR/AcrR family transcriptional regulator [Saprospiraceae bacterium]HPN70518.1 TetR/AcrR family transcriptional regulator [Saprospiraceae bacterium]